MKKVIPIYDIYSNIKIFLWIYVISKQNKINKQNIWKYLKSYI